MALISVLHALWLFLPAYVANMSPVFSAKIVPKWNAPIDGGRVDRRGQRVLGPGKTWRGLVGGILSGALTALFMAAVAPAAGDDGWLAGWDLGRSGHEGDRIGAWAPRAGADAEAADRSAWWAIGLFGAIVGGMALVGDAVKSYFKRRLGKTRGAPWFPFDQLDFVVFGVLAMVAASPLLADGWLWAALFGDWVVLATLFVLTPVLHYLINVVGHRLKLKEVPW